MKRVVVYGHTIESAKKCLTQVLQLASAEVNYLSRINNSVSFMEVIHFNGDSYQAIKASQNCRGIKTTFAFIDLAIDSELIYDVLIPTVINSDNIFFFR